jgi:AAA family ATP:ADP antiporter
VTAFVACGVAVVWVHAVSHFTTGQGKRLFGLVSVGGTLGAIAGSDLSRQLASLPRQMLIVLAALVLEFGVWCYHRSRLACERMAAEHGVAAAGRRVAQGGSWRGFVLVLRSPYVAGIATFVLLSSVVATIFYYQQNGIAAAQAGGTEQQRRLFASINEYFNLIALVIQLTMTGKALLRLGVAVVLCIMPVFSTLGLLSLAFLPVISLVVVIEVSRRTLQFAFDKPAREVLYTPLGIEAKYKSKAFIETTVFRFGDLLGAGLNELLQRWQVATVTYATGAAPVLALWGVLGFWLGRQCQRLKAAGDVAAGSVSKSGALAAVEGSD